MKIFLVAHHKNFPYDPSRKFFFANTKFANILRYILSYLPCPQQTCWSVSQLE